MRQVLQQQASRDNRIPGAAGAGVEAVLFASVQAVMLVCIVLVAAQALAA